MPPKAAIRLNNDYRVETQKDKADKLLRSETTESNQGGLIRTELKPKYYPTLLTKQAKRDLARLDRNKLSLVQEKLRFIAERPKERGDEKSGVFNGFKSLKADGTSHVLLFSFDEQKQRVIIARYEHHDVAYRTVPSIVEAELTALNL